MCGGLLARIRVSTGRPEVAASNTVFEHVARRDEHRGGASEDSFLGTAACAQSRLPGAFRERWNTSDLALSALIDNIEMLLLRFWVGDPHAALTGRAEARTPRIRFNCSDRWGRAGFLEPRFPHPLADIDPRDNGLQ